MNVSRDSKTICLDDWGKPRKTPRQVGRHRDSNRGPPEWESRALPRSHLARYISLKSFVHSLSYFYLCRIGAIYVTHATRTLQIHDLSGEGINAGSHTYYFDHTKTWRSSLDKGSAQWGHLRNNTNMNMANMKGWWLPNDIRGPCGPKTPWHVSYRWKKTPPRKLVPTGHNTSEWGMQKLRYTCCWKLNTVKVNGHRCWCSFTWLHTFLKSHLLL